VQVLLLVLLHLAGIPAHLLLLLLLLMLQGLVVLHC
jgi:hypothetical protein